MKIRSYKATIHVELAVSTPDEPDAGDIQSADDRAKQLISGVVMLSQSQNRYADAIVSVGLGEFKVND